MNQFKNELAEYQTRKHLLNRFQAEKQRIITVIEKFYSQQARNEANAIQTLEEMIVAFDRVLTAGDWNGSLFLRNTVKPLQNMRAEAQHLHEQLSGKVKTEIFVPATLAPDMMKVYISIFQHKAHSVKDWEPQLRSLSQYILGRPIYQEETAARQAIRVKPVQTADAYVCVAVPKIAIQTGDFYPLQMDKQGNALLQLVPGAVRSENILEFVYQDKRYFYKDGKLIELNEVLK